MIDVHAQSQIAPIAASIKAARAKRKEHRQL